MIREVELFDNVLLNIDSPVHMADLVFNKVTFNPNDSSKRPPGWLTIKYKRILSRIKSDYDYGVLTEEQVANNYDKYAFNEESRMLEEVANLNNVVITGQGADFIFEIPKQGMSNSNKATPATAGTTTAAGMNRLVLWKDLLLKRVYSKEEKDRLQGVSADVITANRVKRELEVSELMRRTA